MSAKPTYISSSGSIASPPLHVRAMRGGQDYMTLVYLFFITLVSVSAFFPVHHGGVQKPTIHTRCSCWVIWKVC